MRPGQVSQTRPKNKTRPEFRPDQERGCCSFLGFTVVLLFWVDDDDEIRYILVIYYLPTYLMVKELAQCSVV